MQQAEEIFWAQKYKEWTLDEWKPDFWSVEFNFEIFSSTHCSLYDAEKWMDGLHMDAF